MEPMAFLLQIKYVITTNGPMVLRLKIIENGVTREAHQQAGMEKDSSALSHNGVSEDASIVTPSDPPGIG